VQLYFYLSLSLSLSSFSQIYRVSIIRKIEESQVIFIAPWQLHRRASFEHALEFPPPRPSSPLSVSTAVRRELFGLQAPLAF
jgi:hypothetical protein